MDEFVSKTYRWDLNQHDLMSSPASLSDTWPAKIRQYWETLGLVEQTILSSEDEYRSALSELCVQYKERNATGLSNRIIRQHYNILSIASALDIQKDYEAPGTLTALILGSSKVAIQTALRAKSKLADFAKETQLLDVCVPSLNRETLRMHQNNNEVRQPLQILLQSYMETFFTIFSHSAPPVLCLEKFQKSVEDTKDLFDQQSRNWEVAFEQARQEEQDRVERGRVTVSGNARKSSPFPHSEARFEDIEELGRGQFGHVSKVVQTGNPTNAPVYFARKFISAPSKDSGKRKVIKDMVLNEAEIMKKLQHHHIASMVLWIEEPEGFSLIMPTVADCNLRDFLGDCVEKDFPKDQITLLDNWFGCLTGALTFAHTNLIKHEDLKPSNILIKDDRVYLADFGCAQDFEHSQSSLSKDQTQMGTPVYWPPEPVKERGRKADVFALGCVFSEMFTVRQRRTLDAYMSKRRVDSIEDSVFPHRFSRNLPAVRDWLQALPNVKGDVPELLLKAILIMLHEETEHRQDAKQLKKLLRSEGDLLFCDSCL